MIIHREIGSSYHRKHIVHVVDYSPLMVETKEKARVKERAAVHPPIFVGPASASLFSCFSTASSRERLGGSLYNCFGVKPVNLRSGRMASDARGENEHRWRGQGWVYAGPRGSPCVLLHLMMCLRENY
jgi:hypothetical protein